MAIRAFQQTILPFLCLAVMAPSSPCAGKPTREQVIAFAESCKKDKKQMDLVVEFGNDFSGLDLRQVDFRGYYAMGFESNLRNANFAHCNLQQAEFGGAILDGADLTGANLDGAMFVTASLKHATILRASLKGTQFDHADLSGAKLAGADLSSANITGSHFGGADLSNAVLSGAKNEYWWNDFSNADLTRANLSGLDLNGAQFQSAVLWSADLSGAQLIQADFTGADLTRASLHGANVESAIFHNVQGITDAQRDQLERRAQRWKFELKTAITRFLKAMYFPAYALVVIALVALTFSALRQRDTQESVVVAALLNMVTLVPACALFGMRLLGASPTVQFNGPGVMTLWSAWVGLWPLFMLALLSCLVLAFVLT